MVSVKIIIQYKLQYVINDIHGHHIRQLSIRSRERIPYTYLLGPNLILSNSKKRADREYDKHTQTDSKMAVHAHFYDLRVVIFYILLWSKTHTNSFLFVLLNISIFHFFFFSYVVAGMWNSIVSFSLHFPFITSLFIILNGPSKLCFCINNFISRTMLLGLYLTTPKKIYKCKWDFS